MPDNREVCRNGRIRLAVVTALLVTVGVSVGWSGLLGWPALILALDLVVTATWLVLNRTARPATAATVTTG
jgi:hypothetical protein